MTARETRAIVAAVAVAVLASLALAASGASAAPRGWLSVSLARDRAALVAAEWSSADQNAFASWVNGCERRNDRNVACDANISAAEWSGDLTCDASTGRCQRPYVIRTCWKSVRAFGAPRHPHYAIGRTRCTFEPHVKHYA